jgi:hypothetical protein
MPIHKGLSMQYRHKSTLANFCLYALCECYFKEKLNTLNEPANGANEVSRRGKCDTGARAAIATPSA